MFSARIPRLQAIDKAAFCSAGVSPVWLVTQPGRVTPHRSREFRRPRDPCLTGRSGGSALRIHRPGSDPDNVTRTTPCSGANLVLFHIKTARAESFCKTRIRSGRPDGEDAA